MTGLQPTASSLKPIIVHTMPWQLCIGGAQRFVMDLAHWAKAFAEVHVIFPGNGTDRAWANHQEGIHLHPVSGSIEAEKIVERLRPDLIHCHQPGTAWGCRRFVGKIPMIGTPHRWHDNLQPVDWAIPICGHHINKIRHGVDLDIYRPHPEPLSPPVHVGIVGRIRTDKIPVEFIHALDRWRPNNLKLNFFGRGLADTLNQRLVRMLQRMGDRVALHGDIPPEQMPFIYRQIHILLIPSITEAQPLTALEGLACGLPIVARRVDGLPDTLGKAAILCDSDRELLRAVEWLRDEPDTRHDLRGLARARAEQLYNRKRMLAQYGRAYAQRTGGRVMPPDQVESWQADKPEVSVVIPVYNGPRPEWVMQAVQSVLDQVGISFEIILVDDGCTDQELLLILARLAKLPEVKLIRLPEHQGLPGAINAGLHAARADLIARFDADDIMSLGRLFDQVTYLRRHPDTDMISGRMIYLHEDGQTTTGGRPRFDPDVPLWEQWEGRWPIAHPTVMFRRDVVLNLGGYREDLGAAEDLELWCRMQVNGVKIEVLDKYWNTYRKHPAQFCRDAKRMNHWKERVYREYREQHDEFRPAQGN